MALDERWPGFSPAPSALHHPLLRLLPPPLPGDLSNKGPAPALSSTAAPAAARPVSAKGVVPSGSRRRGGSRAAILDHPGAAALLLLLLAEEGTSEREPAGGARPRLRYTAVEGAPARPEPAPLGGVVVRRRSGTRLLRRQRRKAGGGRAIKHESRGPVKRGWGERRRG